MRDWLLLGTDDSDVGPYDQGLAAARAALGDGAFDEAFAAGQALTLEQAIAEALFG